jgi:hypothetical protein
MQLQILLFLGLFLLVSCHTRPFGQSLTRLTPGPDVLHQTSADEGTGFTHGNNEYGIMFDLKTDIPMLRPARAILDMENPAYDQWIRAHNIERMTVQFAKVTEDLWHDAKRVEVSYTSGSDTSVFNGSCFVSSTEASSFGSLPTRVRLANRKYSFIFVDTFAQDGTRFRIQYSLRRPDGSSVTVDTTINYEWQEYTYMSRK